MRTLLWPSRHLTVLTGVVLLLSLAACSAPSAPPPSPSAETPAATETQPTTSEENSDSVATTPPSPPPAAEKQEESPTVQPITTDTKLSLTGLGAVRIGMTIAQAEAATGMTFAQQPSGGEEYGCLYYTLTELDDVSFMVTEGKIARIEIDTPEITTLSGATLGYTEGQVRDLYPGQIEAEPHEYVPGGFYLIFVPDEPESQDYRVIFETDENGSVTTLRSGKIPEVGYIEGCV